LFRPVRPFSTGLRVEPCNETWDPFILYKHSFHVVLHPAVYFLKWENTQHFPYVCILSFSHFSIGLGTQEVVYLRCQNFTAVRFGYISCLLKTRKRLNCRSPLKLWSFS
jgi:hypothetical protein